MYQFNQEEKSILNKIQSAYYMSPVLAKVASYIEQKANVSNAWQELFDQMNELIVSSKSEVDNLLIARKDAGKIRNVAQARKAVVGQIFPKLLMYLFLHNKVHGNIQPYIFITDRVRQSKFAEMTTIHVGDETQKPDMDIIIYSEQNGVVRNCMIVSLKTSLRERAGQTYKWKLLLEIAQSENHLKEKYEIGYPSRFTPLVCFGTVNFYDEINNPQHRGMFKFFDMAFIGKVVEPKSKFIVRMSTLPEFINTRM